MGQVLPAERRHEISVEETMRNYRARTLKHSPSKILTQELGPLPRAELDALADSLVVIALEYEPGDPEEKKSMADGAVFNLRFSSRAREGSEPYPGALDRLIQIIENSKAGSIRRSALEGVANVPDTARAIAYLGKVAAAGREEEDGFLVGSAIYSLANELGPRGLEFLHQLYKEGRLTHPHFAASRMIGQVRYLNGWD